LLSCWLFCFGVGWQLVRDPLQAGDHIVHHADDEGPWLVRITTLNGASEKLVRADAEVEGAWVDGRAEARSGALMLALMRDTSRALPRAGDRLLLDAPLERIDRVPDPGGFDSKRWAASRGISLEAFAPADHWRLVGHTTHWTDPFTRARQAISLWLNGSALPERERALVKALVLGQRDELDGEQTTAFVRSGTIHVLSVSGMHVGLIFTILTFLFGWWGESARIRIWRGVLVLLALWAYAGLTGGAPSVLRATIMFSLFTVANMSAQRSDNLNSLFSAAFLLLLWEPAMLWQISFQLSFLAVLGIILIYRPLGSLWTPRSKFLRAIWSLSVVSIAAQALTTPVSIYLFKAFPVWFLPANIVVVTAVGFAVYGSVGLVFLYKVPVLGELLTWAMTLLLKVVGAATELFAWLPWAYPAIRIGMLEVWLLYIFVFALGAWWQWQWRNMRWLVSFTLLVLFTAWGERAHDAHERRMLVVYDERDGLMAAMSRGRELVLLCSVDTFAQDAYAQRKVSAHQRVAGLAAPVLLDRSVLMDGKVDQTGFSITGAGRWRMTGTDILFLTNGTIIPDTLVDQRFDAVVLHDLQYAEREVLERVLGATEHLVVAAGVSWRVRRMVEELAAAESVPVHELRRKGAFVLEQ
jgi:ComEC/Rec2-related protein